MYARLVLTSAVLPSNMIRDIIRLCTSEAPSLTDLSENAFSRTSSVIIDDTPAGWTYVTSSNDGLTLASSGTATSLSWWGMKSPCLAPSGTEKFAIFTLAFEDTLTTTAGLFMMSGASGIDTLNTTTVNRGSRLRAGTTSATATIGVDTFLGFNGSTGQTFHLIATPRFVILYKEGAKMNAIFEHSSTGVHEFYDKAPFVQYSISSSTSFLGTASPGGLGGVDLNSAGGSGNGIVLEIFDFTEAASSTGFGVFSFGGISNAGGAKADTVAAQPYMWPQQIATTVASNGISRNIVKPLMFSAFSYGLPTCLITGVCDVFMTRGGAGTTGDTMVINGDVYTYFNVITSGAKQFGLAINTSQTS